MTHGRQEVGVVRGNDWAPFMVDVVVVIGELRGDSLLRMEALRLRLGDDGAAT
ncbi:uncharacterized protein DS421_16g558770 [Arachis hypogaea]|nr:uncharacterized protein DS421_16g558770 [Arachis hypogaea]